ncbi:hypothetical protein HanRHA438_Chr16g0787801 [Helianthus annuus]|nr:hypothetical protein HanRHA438_Chr16g0787801 [Helianthus annuus]
MTFFSTVEAQSICWFPSAGFFLISWCFAEIAYGAEVEPTFLRL